MQIRKLIGRKLKTIRQKSNMTIHELSVRSKVSANMISRVERGLTIPSIEILMKLGSVFGKSICFFIGELETSNEIVFLKKGEGGRTKYNDSRNLESESFTTGLRDPQFSSFCCTVKKGGHSGDEPMHHPGDEWIYLLEGSLKVSVAGECHVLLPGDSLSFKSHLPHSWENTGTADAKVIWTLSQFPIVF